MKDSTRRTIRTAFQLVTSLAVVLPLALTELELDETAVGAIVVSVGVGITRVMALPKVEKFLEQFVPWLAAHNRPQTPHLKS